MTRHSDERDLERLLTAREPVDPPAGLARRIKDEIPDDLGFPFTDPRTDADTEADAGAGTGGAPPSGPGWRRTLLLAATLVLAVGAAFFWTRHRQHPTPAEVASSEPAPALEAAADGETSKSDRSTAAEPAADPAAATASTAADEVAVGDARAEAPGPRRERPTPPPTEPRDEEAAEGVEEAEADDRAVDVPEAQDLALKPEEARRARERLRARQKKLEVERRDRDAAARAARQPAPPPPPPPPPSPLAAAAASEAESARDSVFVGGEAKRPAAPVAVYTPPEPAPSTGGTHVPNDAPYDAVFFDSAGTNPFVDTEDDHLSTFGLDVDTGSYTIARRFLRDGHLPEPDGVRVEEFVNYFDYGDAPPAAGEGDFALHVEGSPSIFADGQRYHLLRFAVRGRDVADEDRPAATLTFVVDISGSMARENRLGLVKQSLHLLLEQLRSDDRVALVVYGSDGRVLLEPTGDTARVAAAIEALRPEGSTNAEEGLRLAYELAARHREAGRIHRVILCSDGVANVGRTSAEAILEQVRRHARQGVELTTVGFGMGNYNDVLMERLADQGNGRYAYVDQLDEARRIFVESLTGTLQTLAAEARAQVDWNPEVVSRWRLLGYENRDIADERFRDDTVDAGEIGAGHAVTVLYEVKTHRPLHRRDRLGTLHLRYASIAAGEMVEQSLEVRGRDVSESWQAAPWSLRLASVVAEFAEVLAETYWSRGSDLDALFRRAQRVAADAPAADPDVAEFASLVGKAARLSEAESP